MIATRRGLAILLALATLLAIVLVLDLRRGPPVAIDRALVPGLDPARITILTWGGRPEVTVTRHDETWTWASAGTTARAEPRVIRDVMSTLRAARWHRRGDVAAAGTVHARLSVTTEATGTTVIGFAAPLAGTEQTWLVIDDHALLVDSWVGRALDPDPLALRVRRPVEAAALAPTIQLRTPDDRIQLAGLRQVAPRRIRVRDALVARLHHALERLEIVRLSRRPPDQVPYIHVDMVPMLHLQPSCPEDPALAWLASDVGDGCIERAAYDELAAVLATLLGPAEQVIEPRPMPDRLDRIVLGERSVLRLDRGPTIDDQPADPSAVAELLAALSAPAEPVMVADGAPMHGTVQLTVHGDEIVVLELLGNQVVRREHEPVGLRLTPAAYAVLTRSTAELADRSVWNEEPTTISALAIDKLIYTRGAVIGEWSRTPQAAVDGAEVEALVAALASPRRAPQARPFTPVHLVTMTVTSPTGAPTHRELIVGTPRPDGCVATSAKGTVLLAAAQCAAIDRLAR